MNNAVLKIPLKAGLVTALVILLYQASNLLLFYKTIKLDYYIAAVALIALITGIVIAKRKPVNAISAPCIDPFAYLTNKEMQIFLLIADGKTNKEIAATNFVEISTIKTHINHIYTKLQISNRKEAVTLYREYNMPAKSTLYPPPVI